MTISKKKLNTDGIFFVGQNSQDVTGSCIYIRFAGKQILLECGLHQSSSNSYLDSYKVNSEKFKFNPNEIDYVFINHAHIDHIGLLPRLIHEGFHGKIILTSQTSEISKALLKNCCFILEDEARVLSKRYNREYSPIYGEDDVYNTFNYYKTYDEFDKIYKLDNVISFKWIKNSHCLGATQLLLYLNDESKHKRVLYTSDVGALNSNNHYVPNTEICEDNVDISIMESTYGNPKRKNKKTREFDREHLRVAVNTVLERKGTVVLPAFSFSRTQELLTELYTLFCNDEGFNYDVIVDSKLSCEICDIYNDILIEDELWNKVINWKNVKLVKEKEDSQAFINDLKHKICISSSGFCTNGRIVNYLSKYLRDINSMIIFNGYTGDNSSYLSYRIQNYKEHKTISINKKPVPNRADCITLSTFSSHASFDDLVKIGSSLNTNKLVLVHGSEDAKGNLKHYLEEAISKNDKSYKVVSSSKDMVIHL